MRQADINIDTVIWPPLVMGKPFSLVRLGDAENSILRYPAYCGKDRINLVLGRILGFRDFDPETILAIRSELIKATQEADVVGLYPSDHEHPECTMYAEHLEYAGLTDMTVCHPVIHLMWAESGVLECFVRMVDRITLICGRDVLQGVRNYFPHAKIDQMTVPTQFGHRLPVDAPLCQEPHWPNAFDRVMDAIAPEGAHHLFLVGAGPFANSYCAQVKRRGGVALDIGSVFDYWAGVASREKTFRIRDGKHSTDVPVKRTGAFLGGTAYDWLDRYRECTVPVKIVRHGALARGA